MYIVNKIIINIIIVIFDLVDIIINLIIGVEFVISWGCFVVLIFGIKFDKI